MTREDWILVDPTHPKLEENEDELQAYYDIVLVRLNEPIDFFLTPTVRPVCLPGPSRFINYEVIFYKLEMKT